MVWEALATGGRHHNRDFQLVALTSHRQVCSMIKAANPAIEVHELQAGAGIRSFTQEAALIERTLGPDDGRIVVTQNRLTRGSTGPQVVLHVNLSRFQPGTGARGWKQRPAEFIRDWTAKEALTKGAANVFESDYLRRAAATRYPGLSIRNPSVAHVGLAGGWALDPDDPVPAHGQRRGRLLAVTSPQPHKDNDTLIRALAELNRDDPGAWTLGICSGREPEAFQPQLDLAASLGVADSVQMLGFLDRAGLAEQLDRTLAVVSASTVESFATIAVEAMAKGVPAIVTDAASMPESVGPDGLLVGPGQARAFAEAAQRLDRNEQTWIDQSTNGRRWAATLSWDRFGAAVMDTIAGVARPVSN